LRRKPASEPAAEILSEAKDLLFPLTAFPLNSFHINNPPVGLAVCRFAA